MISNFTDNGKITGKHEHGVANTILNIIIYQMDPALHLFDVFMSLGPWSS